MSKSFVILLLLATTFAVPQGSDWAMKELVSKMLNLQDTASASGGGIACAGCTIVVGILEQMAQVHSTSVDKILEKICSYFPIELQPECDFLVMTFGPAIIQLLENEETADRVCLELGVCTNATCHLYPLPASQSRVHTVSKFRNIYWELKRPRSLPKFVWPWQRVADHLPIYDADNDYFSVYETLRGYNWRGADCNDNEPDIYPGRSVNYYDPIVDHNCNGIYGTNEKGIPYEDLLCGNTTRMGSILLGDSAGAHFHIPPEWVTASEIDENVFRDLLVIAEDEFDWPMMSTASGYMVNGSKLQGAPKGPIDTAYLRQWKNNHCVFRDYQNIGVNGARSGAMLDTIIKTMARNKTYDHPVFLSYALIGNDVCNPHHSLDSMTTPQEFYQNVVGALQYLDNTLPSGSHVVFIGLVDGRILYDTMGSRIHPLGSTDNNVRYSDFYDFLNCLGISPCFGWMNSDAYWRNQTTLRAFELNKVYDEIIKNHTFQNFDMHYYDCPMPEVINRWIKQGGHAYQLIEPVDGFHPTQISDNLTTEILWSWFQSDNLIPPANPNNLLIEQLFGNQGGYTP